MEKHINRLDRTRFGKAHADTMFVQRMFPELSADDIRPETFAYPPCWGILDPGMTMERHSHPIPEFYVFTAGVGRMALGERWFDVRAGMCVNIPPGVEHEVANAPDAIEPLIWTSIGLKTY